jgi:hypothetical protein
VLLKRRLSAVLAAIALCAGGGFLGQSLAASAGAPKTTLSDKTLYGKANPTGGGEDAPGGGATTLLQVSITAPAAGMAAVDINSSLWTDFPQNTGSTTNINVLTVGRCNAPDSLDTSAPASCANVTEYWFEKYPATPSTDTTDPYAISSLLTFTSAGTRTLFLNAETDSFPAGLIEGAHVQVAFTPKNPISSTATITVTATVALAARSAGQR